MVNAAFDQPPTGSWDQSIQARPCQSFAHSWFSGVPWAWPPSQKDIKSHKMEGKTKNNQIKIEQDCNPESLQYSRNMRVNSFILCSTSPIITHIFWLNPDACSGRWPANLYASWSEGYRLYMGHSGIHLHWILCNIHIIHHIRYLWTFTKHRRTWDMMGYVLHDMGIWRDLTDLTD